MRHALQTCLCLAPLLLATAGCNKQSEQLSSPPNGSIGSLGTSTGSDAHAARKGRGGSRGGGADRSEVAGEAAPAPFEAGDGARFDRDFRGSEDEAIAAEESRPGLGTAYGESRRSSIENVSFSRAEASTPDVVFAIHYDDASGVRAAANAKRTRAWADEALQEHAGLSFALLDDSGRVLPAAAVGSDLWAVGSPDSRYSLAIANDTASAFEVVASVDGLDIIDGRPASFSKRGYIVDPFSSVVIDGWRTSEDSVAAFRFSSVDDSYAERMGDGRNIGVIGAAFFREAPRGWDDWRAPEESWRRDRADPFPGN
jgi:hypothetical protein